MSMLKEFLVLLCGVIAFVALIVCVVTTMMTAYASAHKPQVHDRPACMSYISGEPRPISYCDFKNYESK